MFLHNFPASIKEPFLSLALKFLALLSSMGPPSPISNILARTSIAFFCILSSTAALIHTTLFNNSRAVIGSRSPLASFVSHNPLTALKKHLL